MEGLHNVAQMLILDGRNSCHQTLYVLYIWATIALTNVSPTLRLIISICGLFEIYVYTTCLLPIPIRISWQCFIVVGKKKKEDY